jgi:hypothetical protein
MNGFMLLASKFFFFLTLLLKSQIRFPYIFLFKKKTITLLQISLSFYYIYNLSDKTPIEKIHDGLMDEIIKTLEECKKYSPQYNIDGYKNIWIVKPGALSRGRGIIVFDKIENILELNTSPLQRDGKYVVQKYIERPLLIHKIKFDIRQWFLVTDFNPLTIWMYKDCYLRFCTQKFTLDTTQQSVHLCNYSIQKNYKNDSERSNELPEENMWSNDEFIEKFLSRNSQADAWETIIYPGMKNAIISSMLSTQDIIEQRKNTFELYGADFMIGDDLKPWLIEINCSPTMARSTEITTYLCDNVLEDICKVIIDKKYNKNADTGRFEIIYKGMPVSVPNYLGVDLKVDGHSYKKAHQSNNNNVLATSSTTASTTTTTTTTQPTSTSNVNTTSTTSTINNSSSSSMITKDTISTNNNKNNPKDLTISETLTPLDIKPFSKNFNSSKMRRETTLPSISIATSINELAHKEKETLSHIANVYHKPARSYDKSYSIKETNAVDLSHLQINNRTQNKKINNLNNINEVTNSSNEFKDTTTSTTPQPHLPTTNKYLKPITNVPKVYQFHQPSADPSKSSLITTAEYSNQMKEQQQILHKQQQEKNAGILNAATNSSLGSGSQIAPPVKQGNLVTFKPPILLTPSINRLTAFNNYYTSLIESKKDDNNINNNNNKERLKSINNLNSNQEKLTLNINTVVASDLNEFNSLSLMNLSSNLNDDLMIMKQRKSRNKVSKSVNDCYNNQIDNASKLLILKLSKQSQNKTLPKKKKLIYNNLNLNNNNSNNSNDTEKRELKKREYLSALSNLDEYLKKKRTFLSTI